MAAIVPSSQVSGPTVYVSPQATTYNPEAIINLSAEQLDLVTMTGIDQVFEKTLSPAAAVALLNGFKVSGYTVDRRLGQDNPTPVTDATVSWAHDISGAVDGFKAVIADAINTAVNGTLPTSGKIDKWLAQQLYAAFTTAFNGKLPASDISGSIVVGGNGADISGEASAGVEANANVGSLSVTGTTKINSFAVDIESEPAVAASNLVTQHTGSALGSLMRQIPRHKILAYIDGSAGQVKGVPLTTNAMPMHKGDTISFVFDINVTATSNDKYAGASGVESAPTYTGLTDSFGVAKFRMDMANRRVALRLKLLEGPTANGPFLAADGIRVAPSGVLDTTATGGDQIISNAAM